MEQVQFVACLQEVCMISLFFIMTTLHLLCFLLASNNDDLRKDAAEALCCLAHALGEDFTIFVPSIRKILVKHHLRVSYFFSFSNTRELDIILLRRRI
jgi:hypothetical protein